MNCTHISDLKVRQVWLVYNAGQSTAHGLSWNSEDVKMRLCLSKVSLDTKFSALDDKQAQFLKQDARPLILEFSSVQSLSHVQLFVTPWTAARQASLSITNSRSLPKPMSIESVMPSNHLILCRPLFLLPSIFPSIRVFSNESVLHMRWPKYWSFSFNMSAEELMLLNGGVGEDSWESLGLQGDPTSLS